jgi:DNA polymerase-3 subunit delta'
MPFSDIVGHERAKALLQAAMARDRLAHAYLLHGTERIGKRLLAVHLAQALLCEAAAASSERDSCGQCRGCRQVEGRTHPDFILIRPDPEQTNPQIKIEQIREIEQQLIYRPLIGDRKICLIDDADRLTIGAANALLKTLEEPPDHSLFLLITSRVSALPVTIRSRCQAVRFIPPARTQIEAAVILRRNLPPADARLLAILSEGQLGRALEWDVDEEKSRRQELTSLLTPPGLGSASTVLATAETLAKSDRAAEALEWLHCWLRDMLVWTVSGTSEDMMDPEHLSSPSALDIDAVLDILDEMERLERDGRRHLNLQMALENILLRIRSLRVNGKPASAGSFPRN